MEQTDYEKVVRTRRQLIAVVIAIASTGFFFYVAEWGIIPAGIGGFSIAVLYWYIGKAIRDSQQ